MVTSVYKRKNREGAFLFDSSALRFLGADAVLLPSSLQRMSQVTRSKSGLRTVGGYSEKMICVECFRAKGDGDLKLPCQNPRCHFYCSTSQSRRALFPSEVPSPTFNKEVGYDRRSKFGCTSAQDLQKTSDFLGGYHPVESGWRKEPPHVMAQMQKEQSQSTSGLRLLNGQAPLIRGKPLYFQSPMMSFPDDDDDDYLGKDGGDLVEDAFVSSPLLYCYGGRDDEKQHFVYPEAEVDDDGIFGRFTDFIDYPSSQTPISSALPAITPNSLRASNAFDMTQLKMEMTKAITSQVAQSLAANGRGSPESLKRSSMNDIRTLLGLGGLAQCSETYSRKVFVGGLPPEIDEDDIKGFFIHFGSLTVDWPHKNHSRACIPPKGYAFLLFKCESSVHKLLLSCKPEGEKHFIYMPTSTLTRKKVQIRPWYISDSYHSVDASKPIDPRKAVFVGGVPRPLKASELAEVMNDKYGNVALIMIDSDSELKYPKGAACVVFSSHASYIAAVSARFMQLSYGSLDKKIEIKPYVLEGQMCDECAGVQCSGKPAPFFCGSVTCLQYFCEYCWASVHSMPGRQHHRPLLKDIGDKARFY